MNCLIHAYLAVCWIPLKNIEDLKKMDVLILIYFDTSDSLDSKPDQPDQSLVSTTWGHDDYIGRSLALLKPGGRFMEIGKRGACGDPGDPDGFSLAMTDPAGAGIYANIKGVPSGKLAT